MVRRKEGWKEGRGNDEEWSKERKEGMKEVKIMRMKKIKKKQ